MTFSPIPTARLHATAPAQRRWFGKAAAIAPGMALCGAVTAAAFGIEHVEALQFGRAWLEALVLAILIGTAVCTMWTPGARWNGGGITFSAKMLLEVAVMLLGRRSRSAPWPTSAPASCSASPAWLSSPSRPASSRAAFSACRSGCRYWWPAGTPSAATRPSRRWPPVIGADGEDVAASIAFTAVLGVVVVLGLPLLVPLVGFSMAQFGVFAGLTVYAVPQVIAATAPIGTAAVQLGTLVKLVRVLMLGPVVLALSLLAHRLREDTDEPAPHVTAGDRPVPGHLPLHKVVPWFIVAFLGLATLHTLNLIPSAALPITATIANVLTILSMAALGLGVDVRVVARAGARVTGAVVASLLVLGGVSFALTTPWASSETQPFHALSHWPSSTGEPRDVRPDRLDAQT